jgi:hypothetical protein
MENKRFVLSVAGIFLITVAAGWIHGLPNRYESSKQVAAEAPCRTFERHGHDLRLKDRLVIDGTGTGERFVITDKNLVKEIDDRCPVIESGAS